MSVATNLASFLPALGKTPYREVLAGLPEPFSLTDAENRLYTYLVQYLESVLSRQKGSAKTELSDLLFSRWHAQNVSRIYRLKTYFSATPDDIRSQLLPWGGAISSAQTEALLQAPTGDDVLRLFYTTRTGHKLPPAQRAFGEDIFNRLTFSRARHYIHFSNHPAVVMMAYLQLIQIELDNLFTIIEGIRYGIAPERIQPLLVKEVSV